MTPRNSRTTTRSKTPGGAAQLTERSRFLAELEPFNGLSKLELDRVARSIVERVASRRRGGAGRERRARHRALRGARRHPRARAQGRRGRPDHPRRGLRPSRRCSPACRPSSPRGRAATRPSTASPRTWRSALLSHPEGVMCWPADQRERLIQAARTMRALPDVRNRPVTSLVRSAPLFCEPDTRIREAAGMHGRAGAQRPCWCDCATAWGSSPTSTFATRSCSPAYPRDAPVSDHHDDAGAHHRRRGAGARGEHRDDGERREPSAGARRRGRGGRHPVGQQPHDPRRAQPVRPAPLACRRRAHPGRHGRRPPPTCRTCSSTCWPPTSTRPR